MLFCLDLLCVIFFQLFLTLSINSTFSVHSSFTKNMFLIFVNLYLFSVRHFFFYFHFLCFFFLYKQKIFLIFVNFYLLFSVCLSFFYFTFSASLLLLSFFILSIFQLLTKFKNLRNILTFKKKSRGVILCHLM